MPLLPAEIPNIPETRSEIVPARLARKVGPLFGVPWDDGPFGHRTWVSDYSRITLSEIARGAPLPTRGQSAGLSSTVGPEWQVVDRIGVPGANTPLPNEIANATLNRFGPDTRAAVLLTAVNQLLGPVRRAVQEALVFLVDEQGAPLAPDLRLAAWAVLIIETFRSQPALVAAGIGARAIQRELVMAWQLPRSRRLNGVSLTRCEISAPDRPVSPSQPFDLDVADATFAVLRLDGGSGPALARRLRRDETVDRLLRRLRAAGTLQDASHLWLSERRRGELVVEALVPPTQIAYEFVTQFVPDRGDGASTLPRVPTPGELTALSPLARRALVIALLGVLRHVQFSPARHERTRLDVAAAAAGISSLTSCLAANDPVRTVARCRTALLVVESLRHDVANDLSAAVIELLAATDDCAAAQRAGRLDRGAAAEIIGGANIAVNVVRRTNATDRGAGLPSPADLDAWLRKSWRNHLDALEVDPDELANPDPAELGLLGFHLHNYAAFLAGHPDSSADLCAAETLFRDVVLPARTVFHERGGSFDPLRNSLQVSTRATGALAAAATDPTAARAWAAIGLERMRRALADPDTAELTAGITENAARFALLAAPAVLLALELGVAGAGREDAQAAGRLVELARRWVEHTPGRGRSSHPRSDEVAGLQRRLDVWHTTQRASPNPAPAASVP